MKSKMVYQAKFMRSSGFILPFIIAIVALLIIGISAFVYQSKKVEAPSINIPVDEATTTPIVGGDRDIHGCIGSAGYSWCEVKNKCLRPWEEKCEAVSTITEPVFCTMDAMQCPDGTWIGRSGPNCEFVCPK